MGLMDVGVGAIMLASGLVSPLARATAQRSHGGDSCGSVCGGGGGSSEGRWRAGEGVDTLDGNLLSWLGSW